MTDTHRETADLVTKLRVDAHACFFENQIEVYPGAVSARLTDAANALEQQAAECDTLRAQLADARADVVRMAASKIGDRCEHHTFALKVLESLTTRECPICWKACAEQVEAQLAAREGEIATLKEQVKDAQSEAAVYRHTVAACGAEMDELIAHAGAADHRRLAAEYRATRIKLDEELRQRAEAAEARADTAEAQIRAQERNDK